jgi:hypothetical protein
VTRGRRTAVEPVDQQEVQLSHSILPTTVIRRSR